MRCDEREYRLKATIHIVSLFISYAYNFYIIDLLAFLIDLLAMVCWMQNTTMTADIKLSDYYVCHCCCCWCLSHSFVYTTVCSFCPLPPIFYLFCFFNFVFLLCVLYNVSSHLYWFLSYWLNHCMEYWYCWWEGVIHSHIFQSIIVLYMHFSHTFYV